MGEHARQAQDVLARRSSGLVQAVHHQDDLLFGPHLVPLAGRLEEQLLEEVGAGCRAGQHPLGLMGVEQPGPHQLGGQVAQARGDAAVAGGQFHEVVDVPPRLHQVGQEGGLAQPGSGFQDEQTPVVIPQEGVHLSDQPLPAHEAVQSHPLEDGPRGDVGVPQPLVITDEDPVVVAGDEDALYNVAADGDTPPGQRFCPHLPLFFPRSVSPPQVTTALPSRQLRKSR